MADVLIVEDDASIVRELGEFLRGEGFRTESAAGQRDALALLDGKSFDIALLDVSLTDGNGFSLCAQIKEKYNMPVIFLTASGDEFSVVTGLDLGADDYIAKPFRPRELLSRIRSVLRRNGRAPSVIDAGGLRIDTERAQVSRNGTDIALTALEYRLLLVFAANRGRVLTRTKLLGEIWDAGGDFVNDNTLTVYIKRLRDKLEEEGSPELISTVRGMGYMMDI